jgi:hypothetical protein
MFSTNYQKISYTPLFIAISQNSILSYIKSTYSSVDSSNPININSSGKKNCVISYYLLQLQNVMFIVFIFKKLFAFKKTGWITGYKSIYYYTSGSIYLKLSFCSSVQINQIKLQQLGSSYLRFSSFQLSYSNDDKAYAFLKQVFYLYIIIHYIIMNLKTTL